LLCVCVCINDEHGQETGRLDFSNCISFSKRLSHFDLIECERDNTAVTIYIYIIVHYIYIMCLMCIYLLYIYLRCTFVLRNTSSTLLYIIYKHNIIVITIVSFYSMIYIYNNVMQQYNIVE